MKNVKSSILASINARFDAMKSVEAYKPSAEAMALLASDPLAGVAKLQNEKIAYEAVNAVSPLECVALQAVLGAVVGFETEEEAFAVLNKAKACWRTAKGLRGLFLSTLNEAELGEFNGDLNRSELVAVCKAWVAKGEQTMSAFLEAHKLQKTAGNVLSANGAQVVRIANLPELKEEVKPDAKPSKSTVPPVLSKDDAAKRKLSNAKK